MNRSLIAAAILVGPTPWYCGSKMRADDYVSRIGRQQQKISSANHSPGQRPRGPSKRARGTSLRMQTYNGYAIAIEGIERLPTWDDYSAKVHLSPPDGEEFVVVHVSAKRKGKSDGVVFERFELLGQNGVKGKSVVKKLGTGEGGGDPWRYSTIIEYQDGGSAIQMSREERELNVIFTIRVGIPLKTLKLDDLVFDVSRIKITRSEDEP